MSYVSAHVLDAAAGQPAVGVSVSLADPGGAILGTSVTDVDGRVGELGPEHLEPGVYTVTFGSGDYFATTGSPCFHPLVSVVFTTEEDQSHYHIPLLLSPFAYTTYRGS